MSADEIFLFTGLLAITYTIWKQKQKEKHLKEDYYWGRGLKDPQSEYEYPMWKALDILPTTFKIDKHIIDKSDLDSFEKVVKADTTLPGYLKDRVLTILEFNPRFYNPDFGCIR